MALTEKELQAFNGLIDEDFKNELKESGKNTRTYKEVVAGDYEMRLDRIELSKSKKGDPMVKGRFKILAGEYKNQLVFLNHLVDAGWKMRQFIEWLGDLGYTVDSEAITDYAILNETILDASEYIDTEKLEYQIKYDKDEFGVYAFEVVEIFEKQ